MNIYRRMICLLLSLSLLSGLTPRSAAGYYEDFPHPDTPFSDMAFTGIDTAAVDAFLPRFAADPAGQYPALLDLYDEIATQSALAEIDSDRHAGDEARAAATEQASDDYTYASDRLCQAVSDALASDKGAALRALMTEDQIDSLEGYRSAEREDLDAAAKEAALLTEYSLLPDDDAFPDAAAKLYLRLVALRRGIAERAGFDSYPEYAYYVTYLREYEPEDAARLQKLVKERIAPLYLRCALALDDARPSWNDGDVPSAEELLETIGGALPTVSPELTEAMDFLRRNRLYCIGSDEDMADLGYTISLSRYRSAFLFNKVSSRYVAFRTTVHEFGHFNAAYHDPTPTLYLYDSMDLAELQSQGLELLFLPALQDILAGDSKSGRRYVELSMLTDMLGSVVDGCLYDEFEQRVFADPGITVQGLHDLEQALNEEYGLADYYEPTAYWPYVSHLFYQPCYYISYAASALPALDLWLLSRKDRDRAADVYMKISAARTDVWFTDVLYEHGLCDLTQRGDLLRLSAQLGEAAGELLGTDPAFLPSPPFWGGVLVGFPLGVAVTILVLRLRSRKRAAEELPSNGPELP